MEIGRKVVSDDVGEMSGERWRRAGARYVAPGTMSRGWRSRGEVALGMRRKRYGYGRSIGCRLQKLI